MQDGQASHKEIISSFEHLKDNKDYKKGQVGIIIFYTGHGTWAKIPKGWQNWETNSGYIEVLCPSDIGYGNLELEGIPDRTILALLDQISEAQGNNIVRNLNLFQN